MKYYKPYLCFIINPNGLIDTKDLDFKTQHPWKMYALYSNYVNKRLSLNKLDVFKFIVTRQIK